MTAPARTQKNKADQIAWTGTTVISHSDTETNSTGFNQANYHFQTTPQTTFILLRTLYTLHQLKTACTIPRQRGQTDTDALSHY